MICCHCYAVEAPPGTTCTAEKSIDDSYQLNMVLLRRWLALELTEDLFTSTWCAQSKPIDEHDGRTPWSVTHHIS